MEFDCNFEELKNFEQEAHDCTWIDGLVKRNLEIQFCEFLELLQEFASNSLEFVCGLFKF
jgi:hypothetical protein